MLSYHERDLESNQFFTVAAGSIIDGCSFVKVVFTALLWASPEFFISD